jgi:hypothetical protein
MGLLTGIVSNKAEKDNYDGLNFTERDMLVIVNKLVGLPIWEMHEEKNGVIGEVLSAAICKDRRIKVMINIDENTPNGKLVMQKVRDGKYKGFSCGTDNEITDYMKPTMKIRSKNVREISVVDEPNVEGAIIEFVQSEQDKKDIRDFIYDENGKLKMNAKDILIQKIPKRVDGLSNGNIIKNEFENAGYKLFDRSQKRTFPRLEWKLPTKESKMSTPAEQSQPPVHNPVGTNSETNQNPTKSDISELDKLKFIAEKSGLSIESLTQYAIEKQAEEEKKRNELKAKFLETVEELLKDKGIENPKNELLYADANKMTSDMVKEAEGFMMIATQAGAGAKKRLSDMEAEYQQAKLKIAEYEKRDNESRKEKSVAAEVSNMLKRKQQNDYSPFGFKLPKFDASQLQQKNTQQQQPQTTTVSTTAGNTAPTQQEQTQPKTSIMDDWKNSKNGVPMTTRSAVGFFEDYETMRQGMRTISSSDFEQFKKRKN